MNLHIPPDLSWHQRPKRSSPNCTLALQLPRPAAAHRTPHAGPKLLLCVCARAKRRTAPPHQQPCGRPSLIPILTSLHFTSPHCCCLLHISPPSLPVAGSLRALARPPRLLTESTARQPRSNATGLATLIVSAPDNLCLVGQVQAVQPRPLPAIPVPVCLT